MRILPVIDLKNGHAVRAVAGRRSEYQPIGEPATIAHFYRKTFGFDTAYVADLDAIVHGRTQLPSWTQVAKSGLGLWLDAGVGTTQAATRVVNELHRVVKDFVAIVGLESLASLECLSEIAMTVGWTRLAFSLDLQQGKPITKLDFSVPLEIARLVGEMGVLRLIVLDLADVGVAQGTRTRELCAEIRRELPHIELIAGGGVRGLDDLRALHEAGCDGALVASALHDGRLTAQDVREVKTWRH